MAPGNFPAVGSTMYMAIAFYDGSDFLTLIGVAQLSSDKLTLALDLKAFQGTVGKNEVSSRPGDSSDDLGLFSDQGQKMGTLFSHCSYNNSWGTSTMSVPL